MPPSLTARPALVVAAAATLLVVGSTGGAIAGSMITGAQIKNGTVTTQDIKDKSLQTQDLSKATVKSLRGAKGPRGLQGVPGDPGPANTKTLAFVADTAAGSTGRSVTVGPFELDATCGQSPVVDNIAIVSSVGDLYQLAPTTNVAAPSSSVGNFPPGDGAASITYAAVSVAGDHGITVTASRWRSGTSCRMALTASATD